MIAVIDYGRGNLFSIGQALNTLGADHEVTAAPDRITVADRLILPGVGAFGDAMARLRQDGLFEPIRAAAARGVPLLGICLGAQLLLSHSTEFGRHDGLDLIPGSVERLPAGDGGPDEMRIPNVGWRPLRDATGVLAGHDGAYVYFVHSFAPAPDDRTEIAATIDINNVAVAGAVQRRNVLGFQYHPEKSGAVGLAMLRAFLEMPST